MNQIKRIIKNKLHEYHLGLKHLTIIFLVLIFFQLTVYFIQKNLVNSLLEKMQNWYRLDSAERIANLAATSLELVLETMIRDQYGNDAISRNYIRSFNIILSQQILQKNVQEICLLVKNRNLLCAIDNGKVLYYFIKDQNLPLPESDISHEKAVQLYLEVRGKVENTEQIYSFEEADQIFHVFVPLVPKGELIGVVYIKIVPDFGFITYELLTSYEQMAFIFSILIFIGLTSMYYFSLQTIRERDEAQKQLFKEREDHLTIHIAHQKENLFTKRIYHTHHKAEKIMGFIKQDLNEISLENFDSFRYRISKYANFISRVIYDMKWYDPPLQAIRNPLFKTDINEVIQFIVQNIFLRTACYSDMFKFDLKLDNHIPIVHINEFVIWEIFEPLLQNSIEHSNRKQVIIRVITEFDPVTYRTVVKIIDNGVGIALELLELNENGIKKIFLEHSTTKTNRENSGYGCYIAYEIAVSRCGWGIDVLNLPNSGCQFIITIPNKQVNS